MPAALFIPEEHNCCYRYSYSGALQTPAASVSANNTAQYTRACAYTHTHTHRLTHATHTFTATLSYSGRPPSRPFQCISQSGAVGAGANTSHIELPANEPLAHRTDIRMEHVPAPPAPNHYAHNHLKAKEDGEHI